MHVRGSGRKEEGNKTPLSLERPRGGGETDSGQLWQLIVGEEKECGRLLLPLKALIHTDSKMRWQKYMEGEERERSRANIALFKSSLYN